MRWMRRFRPCPDDAKDALAAKIEARVDHKAALDRYADAEKQSVKLEQINHRNHFSESLSKAFRERPL